MYTGAYGLVAVTHFARRLATAGLSLVSNQRVTDYHKIT